MSIHTHKLSEEKKFCTVLCCKVSRIMKLIKGLLAFLIKWLRFESISIDSIFSKANFYCLKLYIEITTSVNFSWNLQKQAPPIYALTLSGKSVNVFSLCPFAVYYLRYAVRSFFTLSRISLADSKRAGQKVHRKIAVAVQKVKTPLLFVPLFWNPRKILSRINRFVLIIKLTITKETEGFEMEGLERER